MKQNVASIVPFLSILVLSSLISCSTNEAPSDAEKKAFTADLKKRTFEYFWDVVDTTTWQTDDRYPTRQFTSIAATGFALPGYIIGEKNGYITRDQSAGRTLKVLEWLWNSPQGPDSAGMAGYKGFYYHFHHYTSGARFKTVELSTVDTGLLMAGILASQGWYDRDTPVERRIRELADSLYLRVEWSWPFTPDGRLSMGWHPESGFIKATWNGYNEAMILLILAMGSPTYPIPENAWDVWCSSYLWDRFGGQEHLNFSPLFGHQYSQMFIDFRGIQDAFMREKGIDYFENSRRATLANRQYCIENPEGFVGYGPWRWGLTACDGPADESRLINGRNVIFRTYSARGVSKSYSFDDGTLAPTAAGGSIPFEPDLCIRTLMEMKKDFGSSLYKEYGFTDAFNLTYNFKQSSPDGWFDPDYIGIDQGPILIQLENYESGLIWELMKKSPYIKKGLRKAGFTGGWLDQPISD